MKLGRNPSPEPAKFKLTDYLVALPKPPAQFGHESVIPQGPQYMYGNDKYGDCVWAAKANCIIEINGAVGRKVVFSEESVLSDYSAVTGFNPDDPSTDQGTDMQVAASYFRKTGVLDANGNRHKIGAYLAITPGNWAEHLVAMWLFGNVDIGINFPASAMAQFDKGLYWSLVKSSPLQGGHDVMLPSHRGTHIDCMTWGRLQPMTQAFFKFYNDESLVYLSPEMLDGQGLSPEHFNYAQLNADLSALH